MREGFRKKVTLALKKAAEIWHVGDGAVGKGHSRRREQQGQRQGGVSACRGALRSVAGARAGAGDGGDARKGTGPSLQRAAHAGLRSLGPGLQQGKWLLFLRLLFCTQQNPFFILKVFVQVQ